MPHYQLDAKPAALDIAVALDPVTGDWEVNVIHPDGWVEFVGYRPTKREAEAAARDRISRIRKRLALHPDPSRYDGMTEADERLEAPFMAREERE